MKSRRPGRGSGSVVKSTITLAHDKDSAAAAPSQPPTPTDAPPAPWQHISGPLARVLANIARRVTDFAVAST